MVTGYGQEPAILITAVRRIAGARPAGIAKKHVKGGGSFRFSDFVGIRTFSGE
jgi:hypothetical protein